MKKILILLCMFIGLYGCTADNTDTDSTDNNLNNSENTIIKLDGDKAYLNGVEITETDYTWHVNPTTVHEDVENAPAEYYTGTKSNEDIYVDHELYYYPDLGIENYKLTTYDGEREYAIYYSDGVNNDMIFATLPALSETVLKTMVHSEAEASENKVLHINKGGTYVIEGSWNGQINIDVDDEEKVTLILNGVEINCSVAPGIIFEGAYDCEGEYAEDFNTDDAGVTVILNKGTVNTVTGQNVYRMLSSKLKDDGVTQKKVRKYDSAFYSKVSMNIEGEGELIVNSNFEGLDTEMHLTFKSGTVTINSIDDGINVNEDGKSVVSFLGGDVIINHSNISEGDGVDSNGYIIVNGGNITVNGVVMPDNALDSDSGVYYETGTITIDDEVIEKEPGVYREISSDNQGFGKSGMMPGGRGDFDPSMMNQDFDIKEFKEKVNELDDDATLNDVLEILGMNMNREEMMPKEFK